MSGFPGARVASAVGFVVLVSACAHTPDAPPSPPPRTLSTGEVARVLPQKVKDREGWSEDIVSAIRLLGKEPTPERVCAAVAVIDQESGFQADPVVAELPRIVREGLEQKLARLGPLSGPAVAALLEAKAPGTDVTFRERIDKLKTERDLDRLFRDITDAIGRKGSFPFSLSALLVEGVLDDMNPVTTAGSMQVKVDFAKQLAEGEGLTDADVRELLYTRAGGVRFGTARLIGYPASYTDITHRFADYNAGVYASRNAMFQTLLADVMATDLVPDGDLLAYDKHGEPKDTETNTLRVMLAFGASHDISAWTIRRDAKKEKSEGFEKSDTYAAVREAWEKKHGRPAPYARIPDVALASPKLTKPRTTAWFAQNVKRRYDACRARDASPGP